MKVLDEVGPVDMENAKRTLTVILNPAATWKACWGRPLTGSNLASSAALNCESFKRSPASGYSAFPGLKSW